jgi:hypothetical protein
MLNDNIIINHPGYDLCNIDNMAHPLTSFDSIKIKRDATFAHFKVKSKYKS